MVGSIKHCPSLRFLILPAQSCRQTGRASPRTEGSSALALRWVNMLSNTQQAVFCLQNRPCAKLVDLWRRKVPAISSGETRPERIRNAIAFLEEVAIAMERQNAKAA